MATTSTVKQVQLSDVPYTDDWSTYEYLVSVNSALKSLQEQVNALSSRIDNEGVVTGGNDTDGWYVKLPGGKLIQGLCTSLSPNVSGKTITWPVEFIDTAYVVVSSIDNLGTGSQIPHTSVWKKEKGRATIQTSTLQGSQLTETKSLLVLAFGRWT